MIVKTNYDKIDISFHVEKDMVSVLAEHLPAIPVAAWEMYRSIGIGYDFGKDYVSLSTASKPSGITDRMARLYLLAMPQCLTKRSNDYRQKRKLSKTT